LLKPVGVEGCGVTVKSADRTLELLEALADAPRRQSLAELVQALDIPKSSLHGLLRTMVARGWVATDETGTRFGLGLRALRLGASYVDSDDVVLRLQPVLDRLAAAFGETIHLGRLDGPSVVYLAKRESTHPLRLFSAVGRRLPAHATALGKALLATRDTRAVDALLVDPLARLTARTLTRRRDLHADLALTRRRGYAVDREENAEGIACFAVAIGPAPAVDAVSVSVPLTRVRSETESRVTAALLDIRLA
jgi:DNA-binding IclR family transcriptional regulator